MSSSNGKNTPKVSVVIVTKDRYVDLTRCIGSLLTQTKLPDEIVVIDNYSRDNTPLAVKNLKKNSSVKIKYFLEKKRGYASIYNRGLKEATYDWAAFIDDDCVADPDWFQKIKQALKSNKQDVILGYSHTLFSKNPYALATFTFDYMWKENGSNGDLVKNYEILDNKNIVYSRKFLNGKAIRFDESRASKGSLGASEDSDLGLQIGEHKGLARYNKSVAVAHKDPADFVWYWKKYLSSFKSQSTLKEKWGGSQQQQQQQQQQIKRVRLKEVLAKFSHQHKLSFFVRAQYYAIALMTMMANRIVPLIYK